MTAQLRALTDTPPRAAIYLRQSTYREESISLELQELACRDYAERMGYDVVAVREDPGISGRTWKRPGVQEVMAMIESHDADVIVLWKWSRLSRSRRDWALAIDRCDVAGGRIESATEPIDTATASGRFARGVMTEFSAYQSELIGEVWEDIRQRRLRLGLPASGRLPFGWQWTAGGGIEPHPERAPLVVEMYRRYLSGAGSAAIAAWLNSEGIPAPNGGTWARSRPFTVMDSPIHAGLIPYRNETYPGAHDPIIDEPTWAAYQSERNDRRVSGAKPRQYQHLLSALIQCHCGERMHGKGSITGGIWYGGYICARTTIAHEGRAYVSAKTIDQPIIDWLMTFDSELLPVEGDVANVSRRDRILRELNELEGELATLTRQHIKGIIPEVAYSRTAAALDGEVAEHRVELGRIAARERDVPTPDDVASMRASWPEWTVVEKNSALRQMIARIELDKSGDRARIRTTWGHSSVVTF